MFTIPAWLRVAFRYIRPRRLTTIGIIGIISMAGIIIGTAALVIVMSLFNGFRDVAHSLMIGFGPHVQVVPESGSQIMDPALTERALLRACDNVNPTKAVSPVWTSKIILSAGRRTGVAIAHGYSADTCSVLRGVAASVIMGRFVFSPPQSGVVVAAGLAEQLQIRIGDTLRIYSPSAVERAVLSMTMPTGLPVIVRGIFQSNIVRDADVGSVYMNAGLLKQETGMVLPTSVDALVQNPALVPDARDKIEATINAIQNNQRLTVRTWQDANRNLVSTMQLERMGSFVVLSLIILVASFSVVVSLTLGVIEKRRDIAILLSMGFTPKDVRNLYLAQGLIMGIVSVATGVVSGVLITLGQIHFQWIAFNVNEGYLVPALPMTLQMADVLWVSGVGLLLATLASWYPAHRASRTVVAEALRTD